MMSKSTLDLLLKSDLTKIKRPTKEVELKRLSEILGDTVIFKCEALDAERFNEIQENALHINEKGEFENINTGEMQIFTILEGVKEPSLKSKDLLEKFGAVTPKELIKNLLLPGEISNLYNIISELSGFNKDTVVEIKN
ncbi:phage tail assembly chaperone [Clostridium tagluense]|uniref:phage tail assembly chaperone n=1 Tax=Clostridium tagluense TaxID=360422 RepID=UPI001C6EA0F9|nr:XkdN-like protein [Clostridium tagluense]MBW9159345.1 XkdN-like protein [Clostridium tagluense]WLC68080.1 XkdN-like protein [Clostridium tagluense]